MSNQFIEPELDEWYRQSKRRGMVMGKPIPLVFVLLASVVLMTLIWPKASLYTQDVHDCGDITIRPEQKPTERLPLTHNTFCRMTGTVSDLRIFTSGAEHLDGPEYDKGVLPPKAAFEDVRYFSKLTGDKVFVILDAAAEDVYTHRLKRQGEALLGFGVNHVGRIIDPNVSGSSFRRIGNYMRAQFILPPEREIRLFDTTDTPEKHFWHLVAFIVAVIGCALSSFGLIRVLGRRRKTV